MSSYQLNVGQCAIPEFFQGVQCGLVDWEGHSMEMRLTCCCANVCMVLGNESEDEMCVKNVPTVSITMGTNFLYPALPWDIPCTETALQVNKQCSKLSGSYGSHHNTKGAWTDR